MRIGFKNQNTPIDISEEARNANLAVFGIKNTGKAFTFIPSLFEQDLVMKDKGITIIVDTPELAWYLYGMCKINNRKVDILKPSINFEILNNLLFKGEWNYENVKKIYDYEKAIKEKKITIIDMEEEKYGDKAIRACSMLLLQLQSAMILDRPKKAKYSVYIDGAGDYLQYIKNLLKYGDYYGFETTLFFKSREELGDWKILIDNYVRNFILLQGICYEDAKYFGERMNLSDDVKESTKKLLNRGYGEIICEILNENTFKREILEGTLIEFDEDKKKEFLAKGAQWKKRYKEVDTGEHHYQLENEAAALSTDKSQGSFLEDISNSIDEEELVLPEDVLETTEEPIEVDLAPVSNKPFENNKTNNFNKKKKDKFNKNKKKEKVEFKEQERGNGEPQINKIIKTTNVKVEPKRSDFSLLDEFEVPKQSEEDVKNEESIQAINEDVTVEIPEVDGIEEFETEIPMPEIDDFGLDGLEFAEEFPEDISETELPVDIDLAIDLPDEVAIEGEETVQEDKPKEEEFDLTDDTTFSIGGKNYPYRKLNSKKIERKLEDFKI